MAEQEMLPVDREAAAAAYEALGEYVAEAIDKAASHHDPLSSVMRDHRLAATKAADERARVLSEHLADQITHIETRIQDGIEMGAAVWRIALEDIVRENRAALAEAGGRGG